MTTRLWLMYLMAVFVAAGTPGPAILYIMTQSTRYGWKKAIFASLGNVVGVFCLGIVAVTGLGAVLKTSELVFNVVKFTGAGYLLYLGIKMMLQSNSGLTDMRNQLDSTNISSRKIFLQAMGIAVSNPKAIVFLTALLPQFISINAPVMPQFLILIAVLSLFSLSFLTSYAILAHKARVWLIKSNKIGIFTKMGGAVFIIFALLLAVTTNS